ncbi:hypothetical protein GBAR_LOCUS22262 [Geodia barretti]|uniref:Uncharacterized protein n=1 Tax=Geodia barretti TaxID=519541 RepID=A0AA35WZQ8_GEOBA|nr:hypothetical protein GBAR_LOCUS22262 [Geodia barretti]
MPPRLPPPKPGRACSPSRPAAWDGWNLCQSSWPAYWASPSLRSPARRSSWSPATTASPPRACPRFPPKSRRRWSSTSWPAARPSTRWPATPAPISP